MSDEIDEQTRKRYEDVIRRLADESKFADADFDDDVLGTTMLF